MWTFLERKTSWHVPSKIQWSNWIIVYFKLILHWHLSRKLNQRNNLLCPNIIKCIVRKNTNHLSVLLFCFSFYALLIMICHLFNFFFKLKFCYFIRKVKQIHDKMWLVKHKVEHMFIIFNMQWWGGPFLLDFSRPPLF